jgi:hypothetical protein
MHVHLWRDALSSSSLNRKCRDGTEFSSLIGEARARLIGISIWTEGILIRKLVLRQQPPLRAKVCFGLRLFLPNMFELGQVRREARKAQSNSSPAGLLGCATNRSWGPPACHACGSTFHQPLTGSLWPVIAYICRIMATWALTFRPVGQTGPVCCRPHQRVRPSPYSGFLPALRGG